MSEGPGWFLEEGAGGKLALTDEAGRRHEGVEPVRAFPLTAPVEGVSLCDAAGREVAWVGRLDELPEATRRMIERRLARRDFVPVIRRVLSVSGAVEPTEWAVETDRGRTKFLLLNEDDVHLLAGHAALITDSHGVRYLLPDARALDAVSRRLLERFL